MNGILLDTSAYRFLIRGHADVQSAVESADAVFLNAVIVGEIFCGFDRGAAPAKNRSVFKAFTEAKDVTVLSLDEETAVRYAFLFTYLQKNGSMASPNDLWIASTAMQHGLRLVTLDRDYLKIPQIIVDCYPVS